MNTSTAVPPAARPAGSPRCVSGSTPDRRRRHTLAQLALFALVAAPLAADDLVLRYGEPPAAVRIALRHDIRAGEAGVPAGRALAVELAVERQADALTATIASLRATYSAHEMTERLSNGHLVGLAFGLAIAADGRSVDAASPGPVVDIGGFQADGLDLAAALAGWLPELPTDPVGVGSSWTTTRTGLSLEGWSWVRASVLSRHTVLAVDLAGGHPIVTVETVGSGRLAQAATDADRDVGELELTAHWRFDATAGRLLSLAATQRSEGVHRLRGGEVAIRQTTELEISSR